MSKLFTFLRVVVKSSFFVLAAFLVSSVGLGSELSVEIRCSDFNGGKLDLVGTFDSLGGYDGSNVLDCVGQAGTNDTYSYKCDSFQGSPYMEFTLNTKQSLNEPFSQEFFFINENTLEFSFKNSLVCTLNTFTSS